MEFLYPYWLFGLLAISVPIVIHLFNFRRYRKVYFTNLNYLKSIKNETRKQQKVRHLLVLISRILAICCLVFAFARPYIPGPAGEQRSAVRYISIYVDNSMSMQASVNGNSILDLAKAKAISVMEAYSPSDRFQLITNDFEGKHQHYYNPDEFATLLSEVKLSPIFRMIGDVKERMIEANVPDRESEVHQYFISDFQATSAGMGFEFTDTVSKMFLIPMTAMSFSNVYIDSCWFESPYNHVNFPQSLSVRIKNASSSELEKIPVKLILNGRQHALGTVDIASWGSAEIDLPVDNNEAGLQWASLFIEDFPITWDDELYLNWTVKQQIPVLVISEEEPGFYLSGILSNDSVFDFYSEQRKRLDYSLLGTVDLVVLDNIKSMSTGLASELNEFVSSGGSLLWIPSREADINELNRHILEFGLGSFLPFDTTRLAVTDLDASHKLFEGVFEDLPENLDLPIVFGHYPLVSSGNAYYDPIMDLQNGDPYLIHLKYGDGKVYLLTTPVGDEFGNLSRHAVWVPVLYRMAMMSRPHEYLFYTMGNDMSVNADIELSREDGQLIVSLLGNEYEFIPAISGSGKKQKLLLYDRIRQAGHYGVFSSGNQLIGFSYNYDRMESDPLVLNEEQLREVFVNRENVDIYVLDSPDDHTDYSLAKISYGEEMWKLFIWLGLLFILLEILLLRLFRK